MELGAIPRLCPPPLPSPLTTVTIITLVGRFTAGADPRRGPRVVVSRRRRLWRCLFGGRPP